MRFLFSLVFILFTLCTLTAQSYAESLSVTEFGKLPILNEGRIKPLTSFATIELKKFSGRERFKHKNAIEWLANTIFDPASATEDEIFFIPNETTRHALGLNNKKDPRYSLIELSSGLQKTVPILQTYFEIPSDKLTKDEKDLMSVHNKAMEYSQILRSLSLALPLQIEVPPRWAEQLNVQTLTPLTYLDLVKIEPVLDADLKSLIAKKGENPDTYTQDEVATALLGMNLKTLKDSASGNTLFRVIPNAWDQNNVTSDTWISPWALMTSGQGSPQTLKILLMWKELATAYQNQDTQAWNTALSTLASAQKLTVEQRRRLDLESFENTFSVFMKAQIFFVGSFLTAILALVIQNPSTNHQSRPFKITYQLSFWTLLVATVLQGAGLAFRIYVLERPPVGTLYESLLFVGFIVPIVALFLESKFKNVLGILTAGFSAIFLGLLAKSLTGDEDNMKVLTAVLNTQFWLTTHVLCITIGYGWCLVTSGLSHLFLILKSAQRLSQESERTLTLSIHLLSLFSLLFTAVGTILGGIWADQSWGRFWGWDPKENGALLIVLWLAWLIHGKVTGQLSSLQWHMGMAFLSVIVALAWIGVNLLGVGLHSYGFTEGLFWGLIGFIGVECLLIGGTAALIRHTKQKGLRDA